jgi:hypothetical protein
MEKAMLFGLPEPLARFNARVVELDEPSALDVDSNARTARCADGSVVRAPRANLLLAEDIDAAFAAPLDRVIPLDAVVAWRAGPDERDIVATVPVPAGAVFKTAVLQVVMTAPQIDAVIAKIKTYTEQNLKRLMGLEDSFEQRVVFATDFDDHNIFVGAFVEQLLHNPVVTDLMAGFDFFVPKFLEQQWARCASQNFLWLAFWLDELAPRLTRKQVWRVVAFVSAWIFPHPCPEHKHGVLLFGNIISLCRCPEARWAEFLKIKKGMLDPAPHRHQGQHLSTGTWNSVRDGFLVVLVVRALAVGDPFELDYGPNYFAKRDETVLDTVRMPRFDALHWTYLYVKTAGRVSDKVGEHLALYLKRHNPGLLEPATQAGLPLCANAACNLPMQNPLVCGQCGAARYCNRQCQVAAWRAGHKAECQRK